VWSFAMLLITGLDLALVGVFDFEKTAFYAVAASLVAFIAGFQNAIFNAFVPTTAVLHARGDSRQLGRMVIDGTRYGMFLLLLAGLPLLFAGGPILRVWVGPAYAARTVTLLRVLVLANIVRLSAVPYVVTLIGTGQQRLVVLTPLLEGLTNLSVSVFAGYYWGAMGVAIGTLCGAFVGVAGHFFYNMPRTTEIRFGAREYAIDALLRPILCVLPLGIALLAQGHDMQNSVRVLTIFLGGTATLYGSWRWGSRRWSSTADAFN
jgi:O-antigen/teichoic acid export membrane protein